MNFASIIQFHAFRENKVGRVVPIFTTVIMNTRKQEVSYTAHAALKNQSFKVISIIL